MGKIGKWRVYTNNYWQVRENDNVVAELSIADNILYYKPKRFAVETIGRYKTQAEALKRARIFMRGNPNG